MKGFGTIMLALTSAAVGAAAAIYAMKKRDEIEQYDYDFDDDDEVYFDEDEGSDMDELNSLDADITEAAEAADESVGTSGEDF